MRKKLCWENLYETIANYEEMDLIFDVDGVKVVAKGITDYDPHDPDFFESEKNIQRALSSARDFDIEIMHLIDHEIYTRNLSCDEMGNFTISKPGDEYLDEVLDTLEDIGAHWEIEEGKLYVSFSPANLKA